MDEISLILNFLLGASVGSFINVVLWRLPKKQSILLPRSYCPKCKIKIKWHQNIPILSYLILKGKCNECDGKIEISYLFREIFTAIIFTLLALSKQNFFLNLDHRLYMLISWIFFTNIIILFFFDLKFLRLPVVFNNIGIFGGLSLIVIYSIIYKNFLYLNNSLAALIGSSIMLLIYILGKFFYRKEVLGLGDIRLIFMIGLWIGIKGVLLTIYLSYLGAGFFSFFLILLKKANRKTIIPFGPFLLISCSLVWMLGADFFQRLYFSIIDYLY